MAVVSETFFQSTTLRVKESIFQTIFSRNLRQTFVFGLCSSTCDFSRFPQFSVCQSHRINFSRGVQFFLLSCFSPLHCYSCIEHFSPWTLVAISLKRSYCDTREIPTFLQSPHHYAFSLALLFYLRVFVFMKKTTKC